MTTVPYIVADPNTMHSLQPYQAVSSATKLPEQWPFWVQLLLMSVGLFTKVEGRREGAERGWDARSPHTGAPPMDHGNQEG